MATSSITANFAIRDEKEAKAPYLGAIVGVSFDGSPCPQAELETCW